MAEITTLIDSLGVLTKHTVHGTVTSDEIFDKVRDYYRGIITKLILWDFTNATITHISGEEIKILARLTKNYSHFRPGGKTALVMKQSADYGMGRMFEICSSLHNEYIEFRSFTNMQDAMAWLEMNYTPIP